MKKCVELQREVEVSVPLYAGPLREPVLMATLLEERRRRQPLRSLFDDHSPPALVFRAGPLDLHRPPEVPHRFVPPTMIADHDTAMALGVFLIMLRDEVMHQSPSHMGAVSSPILAGFLSFVDDEQLLRTFLANWTNKLRQLQQDQGSPGRCSPPLCGPGKPAPPPKLHEVVRAFKECCLDLVPLVSCLSLLRQQMSNFAELQDARERVIQQYCYVKDPHSGKVLGSRHPSEPLSHAGMEFLHKPFDVAETRVCLHKDQW